MSLWVMNLINNELVHFGAFRLVMNLITALQRQAMANSFKAFTRHCPIIVVKRALMNIIKCCFLVVLTSPYSALLVISHCTLHRKDSLCALAHWLCISRKGGTGGGGWSHQQDAEHTVPARLGFEKAMVGTGRATPCPDYMDRLRKH